MGSVYMIEQVKTAYMYLIIMGIGIILLIFSMMVPILSSTQDFSIYNTGWNGCSNIGRGIYENGSFLPTIDLSASSEESIAHNPLDDLEGVIKPKDSCIFMIGPDIEFTDDEGRFIDRYLKDGGIVLLADDVGTGNDLLGRLNTTTRITSRTMYDLAYNTDSPFAITTEFSDHPITQDISMLILNYASTISPSERSRPIVNSSRTSWLSNDDNKIWDDGEPQGPFPLMTIEPYGRGTIIVLSDPSLLINNMNKVERGDNAVFIQNLVKFMTEGRSTTVIDESHRDLTNPVQYSNIIISRLETGPKVAMLTVISAIFIILNTSYPKRSIEVLRRAIERLLSERHEEDRESRAPIEIVMEKHPKWDRKVLDRIIKDIEGSP